MNVIYKDGAVILGHKAQAGVLSTDEPAECRSC